MNFSQPGISEHSDFCYESVNTSCPKTTYPTATRIILYVFLSAMMVVTMCGNLLVIISIVHFKQLHTPTNCLILSLAVTDFLMAVAIMPASMVRTIETCWYFGEIFCKLHLSTDVMLSNVSILNLSFISIDRYYAVCQPLHYRTKITSVTIVIMIVISWNLSFTIAFGMVFMKPIIWDGEDSYYNVFHCLGSCFIYQTRTSSIVFSVLSFYIPGLIMIAIYQKIFHIAKKQARAIHGTACQQVQSGNSTTSSNKKQKATKTLAIVMGVFLSSWLPFFVCNLIDPIINYSIPPALFDALFWVGYFNSTCNPIVYAFFYSWFRKAFKMIIDGKIFQANSSRTKLSTD